jgi:hypothetical protein
LSTVTWKVIVTLSPGPNVPIWIGPTVSPDIGSGAVKTRVVVA